jgi:hypothetical protein
MVNNSLQCSSSCDESAYIASTQLIMSFLQVLKIHEAMPYLQWLVGIINCNAQWKRLFSVHCFLFDEVCFWGQTNILNVLLVNHVCLSWLSNILPFVPYSQKLFHILLKEIVIIIKITTIIIYASRLEVTHWAEENSSPFFVNVKS